MNVWGKVFVWFTAATAVAAMLLAARTFDVRNSWIRQARELQAKNEDNARQIAEKSKELKDLRADLARTMLGWDMYWNGVAVQITNPQTGEIRAALGKNYGFGYPEKPVPPVAYAFRSLPDGSSQYIGVFQPPGLENVRESETSMAPAWRMGPDDIQRFGQQQQQQWRFRSVIPPRFVEQFSDYEIALTIADEQYTAQEENIATQQKLDQVAQQHLDYRLAELNGSPDLQQFDGQLPPEKIVGLRAALVQEEEDRNAALIEMHRLRRELKDTYHRFEELRKGNLAIVQGLPAPLADARPDRDEAAVVANP